MITVSAIREPIVAPEKERLAIRSLLAVVGGEGRNVRLIDADGRVLSLPKSLGQVLAEAARHLAAGRGVAILPYTRTLTTQQTADLLNVSRPHLVTLLEANAIPFHRVGTHRRVVLADALAYKADRDAGRRRALQAIVDEAQETSTFED